MPLPNSGKIFSNLVPADDYYRSAGPALFQVALQLQSAAARMLPMDHDAKGLTVKTKIKGTYTRQELAEYLEKLSSQVRTGIVEVGEEAWNVPESVRVSRTVKEKKGIISCKLEWQWPVLLDHDEAKQKEVIQWQSSFKKVKKDLARSFKQLKKAINDELSPNEAILDEFATHSRAFVDLADPEWQDEASEYMDHLENLVRSIELNQRESVLHELNDLQNRMNACHREFR